MFEIPQLTKYHNSSKYISTLNTVQRGAVRQGRKENEPTQGPLPRTRGYAQPEYQCCAKANGNGMTFNCISFTYVEW